jgi:hypothetical protein
MSDGLRKSHWSDFEAQAVSTDDWIEPSRPTVAAAVHREARSASSETLRQSKLALDELEGLGDDWDGEGAIGVSEATIRRARELLDCLWINCRNRGAEFPAPSIGPCADGSIDFFWKFHNGKRRVLLNILGDADGSFSGSKDDGLSLSGNARQHLAALVDWILG